MEKKITKKDRYNQLLAIEAVASNQDMVDFIKHEIELLGNKRSSGKLTKAQEENLILKNQIIMELKFYATPMTVTELCNTSFSGYTNQKNSSMLRQLVEEEKVVKTTDKKVAKFSLPVVEEETEEEPVEEEEEVEIEE